MFFALVVSGSNPLWGDLRVLESVGSLAFWQYNVEWISRLRQKPSLRFPLRDVFRRDGRP